MNNLVPTPRQDKNGRIVTRHMKPASTGSSIALPVPQLASEAVSEDFLDEVAEFITEDPSVKHYRKTVKEYIQGYSKGTLDRILSDLTQPSHLNLLIHGFTMDWDESKINDYISIAHAISDNSLYSGDLGNHMSALPHYEGLTPFQPGKPYPQERAAQCHAIVAAGAAIHWHVDPDDENFEECFAYLGDDYLPYITNDKLRDLILHSEKRNEIARLIKERGITNPDTLMEFINTEAPAVAHGML